MADSSTPSECALQLNAAYVVDSSEGNFHSGDVEDNGDGRDDA
jgi:hypothetical protein